MAGQPSDFLASVPFLLEQRMQGGTRGVATDVTFEEIGNSQIVQPTVEMSMEDTQSLFDALWRGGFRPKDGTGNSGHMGAMENHLADMRANAEKWAEAMRTLIALASPSCSTVPMWGEKWDSVHADLAAAHAGTIEDAVRKVLDERGASPHHEPIPSADPG